MVNAALENVLFYETTYPAAISAAQEFSARNDIVNFHVIVAAVLLRADVEDEELKDDPGATRHAYVPSAHDIVAIYIGIQRRGESAAEIEYATAATTTCAISFFRQRIFVVLMFEGTSSYNRILSGAKINRNISRARICISRDAATS